jgi:DNA invertase Pin-like site-specific DNA recombinase
MPEQQHVYAYARVSVNEKKKQSISIDSQLATIHEYAAKKGLTVEADFVDDGVSGSIALDERPAGKKLGRVLIASRGTMLVTRIDRAFRDLLDMAVTLNEWKDYDIHFVSATQAFDLTTPHGRFLLTILTGMAQLERELIRERIIDSVQYRKSTGLRYSIKAPYGFRFEGGTVLEDGRKVGEKCVPDEKEQNVLKKIASWHKAGKTMRAIADRLNELEFPTRSGRPWRHSTVQDIIASMKDRIQEAARSGAGEEKTSE